MTLFQFMNLLITLLAKNGQYRTMLHYKATLNSYKRFRDNKDIALKDIDAEEMRSYEAYLQNIVKVCNNTSSFYLRGISFIDLAHLRKSDLKEGYLQYTRRKTGQRISIRLEEKMQAIMDKYQNQTASSPYLFPFLIGNKKTALDKAINQQQEELRLYHNAEARITYHLKKIGEKLDIKGKLTLYVARHSWATAARDKNIPISIISRALGHNSETTTEIYLNTIKNSEVDDANARILAAIWTPKATENRGLGKMNQNEPKNQYLYIRDTEDVITFILSITYNIRISIVIEKTLNSVE